MVENPSKAWAALVRHTAQNARKRSRKVKEQIYALDKELEIITDLVQDLIEVANIHKPDAFSHCTEDQQVWPCDTARAFMKTYERIVQEWE